MTARHSVSAAILVALGSCPFAATAADIHVPAEQSTIQQGIAAANPGDRVLVAPGTYAEHIDFVGKDIVVESTGGAAVTTIDGTYSGIVATFAHGESPAAVLRGFTITRGAAGVKFYGPHDGGGIRIVSQSSPTIESNDIHHNLAHTGGGIYVSYSSPVIRDNLIHDNRCNHGDWGGGIFVSDSGSPEIDHNLIHHNRAQYGAGLAIHGFGGMPKISRNVITFNQASADGGGIEAWLNARFVDNLVHDNEAPSGAAAGVVLALGLGHDDAYMEFINNTFADNHGDDLHVDVRGGRVVFLDTIVRTSGGTSSIACAQSGAVTFDRSLVFATNGAQITGNCDVAAGGLLEVDPMFVGAGHPHPYVLGDGSPAIDAGNDAYVRHVRLDLAGHPRIQGAAVDLGAYERAPDD